MIYIGLADSSKIPVNFASFYSKASVVDTITPFHRQNGYQIDERDLDSKERQKKYELESKSDQYIDEKLDPNWIYINSSEFDLERAGINKKVNSINIFSPEMTSLLNRLRIKLKFPGSPPEVKPDDPNYFSESVYESKPWSTSLNTGSIWFRIFYPADTGPLQPVSLFDDEGFSIHTPANLDVLKTIKAEFYLAEDEQAKQTSLEPTPQPPAEYILPLGVKRKT